MACIEHTALTYYTERFLVQGRTIKIIKYFKLTDNTTCKTAVKKQIFKQF